MKIVCEHCGAKYSIPDDKVAGKTFKIRCKKCSALLVLRGDQSEDVPTKTNPGLTAEWHVVVDGEQQGPLTVAQMKTLFGNGKVNWESFVWRDGMSDWVVAQDVKELPNLLGMQPPAATEQKTAPHPNAPEVAQQSTHAQESMPVFGEQAASAGNMFADFDVPVTVDAPALSSMDAFASASAGKTEVNTQPLTFSGQRHENSLLFSLGNLKAISSQNKDTTGGGSGAAASNTPAASEPAPSKSDASGLFDIRALMQQSQTASAAKQEQKREASSPRNSSVSDLFRADAGMVIPATLGAPALPSSIPPAEKKKLAFMIGGAVAGALLLLTVTVLIVRALSRPEPVVVTETGVVQTPTPQEPVTQPAVDPRPSGTSIAPPVQQPANVAPPQAAVPKPEPVAVNQPKKPAREAANALPARPKKPVASAPIADKEPAKPTSSSKDKDIDDLMNDVLSGGSTKKPRDSEESASVDSSLPASPSRGDVLEALNGVSGAVRSCGGDKSGVANVAVVFSGASGRVKSANISGGEFKGTPEGKCIENAVERARIPRFQQTNFKVTFPYRI